MKPPKTGKQKYYATHRVSTYDPAVWEMFDIRTEDWVPVAYEDVPDAIWGAGLTRDGWRFYTDRKYPFPGPRPGEEDDNG